jgi:hypothetical protein
VNELSATLLPFQKILCSWKVDERFAAAMMELYQKPVNERIWDLRLYDTTGICFDGGNTLFVQTYKIAKEHHSWILNGLQTGHSYTCELGFWTVTHEFFPLLRSNEVHCSPSEKRTGKIQNIMNVVSRKPKWRGHVSTYSYYE